MKDILENTTIIEQKNPDSKLIAEIISDENTFLINLKQISQNVEHEILMTEDFFHKISDVIQSNDSGQYHKKINKIKKQYPKAYEKWTFGEEIKLKRLFALKKNVTEIAEKLERQPSAIESRLKKMGLI